MEFAAPCFTSFLIFRTKYTLLSRLNFGKIVTFKPRRKNINSSQTQPFIFWTHAVSANDSQHNKPTNPCYFYKAVPPFENNFVTNDMFCKLTVFNIHFIVGKKLRFDKEENSFARWPTRLQRTTYIKLCIHLSIDLKIKRLCKNPTFAVSNIFMAKTGVNVICLL